jgi:hypothetical protein
MFLNSKGGKCCRSFWLYFFSSDDVLHIFIYLSFYYAVANPQQKRWGFVVSGRFVFYN